MSNTEILDDLDRIVVIGRRYGDEIRAQRDHISRLEALLREQEAVNRQLLAANLQLKSEVDAAELAREHADSLI